MGRFTSVWRLVLQASGLTLWLKEQMHHFSTLPPWAMVIIICLLIATITEFASNGAIATIFLPVLANLVSLTSPPLKQHFNTLFPQSMPFGWMEGISITNRGFFIVLPYFHTNHTFKRSTCGPFSRNNMIGFRRFHKDLIYFSQAKKISLFWTSKFFRIATFFKLVAFEFGRGF